MTAHLQTIAALVLVAAAIGGLIWRAVANRGKHSCGGGCPTDDFKAQLKK